MPDQTPAQGPAYRRLQDPRELAALAHPVRLGIMELLTVSGPLTATELADRLDETPANCSWHLRKLAEHHFVEEAGGGIGRQRPWKVRSIGLAWDESDASPGQVRAETALAGFAQFNLTAQNADPTVVTDAVAAAVAGVRAKGSAPT